MSGLSGLTRKCHGPFLGGWGAAMPPGYPTKKQDEDPYGREERANDE